MPDNISPEQFASRIDLFESQHNRHLGDRAMTGKRLSQFYPSQLPPILFSTKINYEAELDPTDGWEDTIAVLDRCQAFVARVHKPTKPIPALPVIGVGGVITLPSVPAPGWRGDGGRGRGGRGGGRAGRGGRGDTTRRAHIDILPDNQLCPEGFFLPV